MQAWKQALTEFYGKDYSRYSTRGGYLVIQTGDVINPNQSFVFARNDGYRRMTKKGRNIIELNKQQFIHNLEVLGIIEVGPIFTKFEKIAYSFNNDSAPKLKRQHQREDWAKKYKNIIINEVAK